MKNKGYWSALERLKNNEPIILPKGSKVTKQNVALEAGKANASSIRKGRGLDDLIIAIEKEMKPSEKRVKSDRISKLIDENNKLQDMLDIAHAKYLASLHELLKNGHYTVKKSPIEVVNISEIDNAIRPVLDNNKPKET